MIKTLAKLLKSESKPVVNKAMDAVRHNNLLCKFYDNRDPNGCRFVRMSLHRDGRKAGLGRLVNSYDAWDAMDLPAFAIKIANWFVQERTTPTDVKSSLTQFLLIAGLMEDLTKHCGDRTSEVLTALVVLADQFRNPSALLILLDSVNQQKREARLQSVGATRMGAGTTGSAPQPRDDRKVG